MFSKYFLSLSASRKIAYLAVFVALSVVANTVLDIDVTPQNKITFTYFVCFLAAYLLGGAPAFLVAFLGDALGYLIMPDGIYWFYGLTLALFALTAGLLLRYLPGSVYLKTGIVCAVCYVVFTVCLNSLVNYTYVLKFVWDGEVRKSLWVYLAGFLPPRLAIQTAVYAGNFVLCFSLLPLLGRLTGRAAGKHADGKPQEKQENG